MAKDNRGMSLVELIIVVAIMSTIIGVAGFGLSFISGRLAESCAQKLTSAMQHTRTVTMGKNKTSITLFMNAQGQIVVKERIEKLLDNDGNTSVSEEENMIGDKGVKVTCTMQNGGNIEITGSNTLELTFDRGSGALKTTKVNGVESDACIMITVSKGNRIRYIEITPITGKISLQ